jgi:hypothetical protein
MRIIKKELTSPQMRIGKYSSLAVFFLLLIYLVVTILGFLSLESPSDPIGDPYFTLMELLILIIAPLILIVMVIINAYADYERKIYGKIAVYFMIIMTAITSSVHFTILSLSQKSEFSDITNIQLFFSFKWPSVVYVLDILAWDFFFAISFLFGSLVFNHKRLEKVVKILMIVSGLLSLIGLLGVPLNNMQIRNIGIIGYAIVSLPVFLLLSKIFNSVSVTNRN